ncbi:MAG: glycosyltransferase family 4 protein [Promethearchaeota archaeon]
MNILLFPTRFFPAISGGDFLLERLGREFHNIKKRKPPYSSVSPDFPDSPAIIPKNISIFTSTAIDFGALHGKGKKITPDHRYFSEYNNLSVRRFEIANSEKSALNQADNKELVKLEEAEDIVELAELVELVTQELPLKEDDILSMLQNGPILPELTRLLRNHNLESLLPNPPNIIHCTYMPYLNLIYALLIGKYYQIPTVVTPFLHDSNLRYQDLSHFRILALFDAICACTNYEKQQLIAQGIDEKRIHIIPMGVDWQKFSQPDQRPLFNRLYHPSHPVLLYCGYKNYEKGTLTLLKVMPLLLDSVKSLTFIFIGPSTIAFNYQLAETKKACPNYNIINLSPDNLTGIFDKKKIGAFQVADIFCMPSRSDAYGIAYLEAWATKTPVIGANIPAMQEVIQNGEDGILVEFDNVTQLRDAILHLLEHPKKRKEMGERGFLKVKEFNEWSTTARKTLRIYEKLTENLLNLNKTLTKH